MHNDQFYDDEGIILSSRARRWRAFIGLVLSSVVVVVFLITSVVFVTLYPLLGTRNSQQACGEYEFDEPFSNESRTQCTWEYQTTAGRKPSQSTTEPIPPRSTAAPRTSLSTVAKSISERAEVRNIFEYSHVKYIYLSTARPKKIFLSTLGPNLISFWPNNIAEHSSKPNASLSTPRSDISLSTGMSNIYL